MNYYMLVKQSLLSVFKQLNKACLIKEIRQWKNKPHIIYIGKTISEINEDFINWKSENKTTGNLKFKSPEVRKSQGNKNNIIKIRDKIIFKNEIILM